MATQKGRNWSSGDIVTAANLSSIERGVSEVAEEYTPTTWANGNIVTAAGLNNIEQGIVNASGGGDISVATVNVSYVDNPNILGFTNAYVTIYTDNGGQAVNFYYSGDGFGLPLSELGTPTQLLIPIYDGCKSDISQIVFQTSNGDMIIDTSSSSVVSGSAEIDDSLLYTWGDCVLNLALTYND